MIFTNPSKSTSVQINATLIFGPLDFFCFLFLFFFPHIFHSVKQLLMSDKYSLKICQYQMIIEIIQEAQLVPFLES